MDKYDKIKVDEFDSYKGMGATAWDKVNKLIEYVRELEARISDLEQENRVEVI